MQTKPESPFGSVIGLGKLKGEHARASRDKRSSLLVDLALVAAGPALALFAAYEGWGYDTMVYVCVAAPMVAGVYLAINHLRHWSVAAAQNENGLAFSRNRGAVVQARWDEVDTVHQAVRHHYHKGKFVGRTHKYTVRTKTGQEIVLTTDAVGENVEALGNAAQRGSAAAITPLYWQSLQSGQRVAFGPLAMDRDNVYAGKKALRWDEIESIKVEATVVYAVVYNKKNKDQFNWASAAVEQIPNFYVFCDLVSRFANFNAANAIAAALGKP